MNAHDDIDALRVESALRRLVEAAVAFDDVLSYLETQIAVGTSVDTIARLMRRALEAEVNMARDSLSVLKDNLFADDHAERLQYIRHRLNVLATVCGEVDEVFRRLPQALNPAAHGLVGTVALRMASMRVLASHLEDQILMACSVLEHAA